MVGRRIPEHFSFFAPLGLAECPARNTRVTSLRPVRASRQAPGSRSFGYAAFCHGSRVQQTVEILGVHARHFGGHVSDAAPFRIGLLGDGRALLISDHRVECRDQNRVSLR